MRCTRSMTTTTTLKSAARWQGARLESLPLFVTRLRYCTPVRPLPRRLLHPGRSGIGANEAAARAGHVLSTPPTTFAGVADLLDFVGKEEWEVAGAGERCCDHHLNELVASLLKNQPATMPPIPSSWSAGQVSQSSMLLSGERLLE
jgi:hypothetical protein